MTAATSQSSPSTIVRRSRTRVAYFDASLAEDLIDSLWEDPAAVLSRGEKLQFKGVRHTVRLSWQSQPLVLKHYVEPSRRHALKQLVLSSRAWKTWAFSQRLADYGVATPRPVACIENRWGALRRDSYLMYPYVEGKTLHHYFAGEAKQSPALHERLWQQLNEVWQQLIELRASLEDTNVGNFIICPAGRLWLIDLDKSRFHTNPNTAAAHQERAWKKLLRSASKC